MRCSTRTRDARDDPRTTTGLGEPRYCVISALSVSDRLLPVSAVSLCGCGVLDTTTTTMSTGRCAMYGGRRGRTCACRHARAFAVSEYTTDCCSRLRLNAGCAHGAGERTDAARGRGVRRWAQPRVERRLVRHRGRMLEANCYNSVHVSVPIRDLVEGDGGGCVGEEPRDTPQRLLEARVMASRASLAPSASIG